MVAASPPDTPTVAHHHRGWPRATAYGDTTSVFIIAPCTALHSIAARRSAFAPTDLLTHDLGCGSQICMMGWPSYSADRCTVNCVFAKKKKERVEGGANCPMGLVKASQGLGERAHRSPGRGLGLGLGPGGDAVHQSGIGPIVGLRRVEAPHLHDFRGGRRPLQRPPNRLHTPQPHGLPTMAKDPEMPCPSPLLTSGVKTLNWAISNIFPPLSEGGGHLALSPPPARIYGYQCHSPGTPARRVPRMGKKRPIVFRHGRILLGALALG